VFVSRADILEAGVRRRTEAALFAAAKSSVAPAAVAADVDYAGDEVADAPAAVDVAWTRPVTEVLDPDELTKDQCSDVFLRLQF
jgi:hypothetical protein